MEKQGFMIFLEDYSDELMRYEFNLDVNMNNT